MSKLSASPGLQEPEIKGLRGEVLGLKTVILAKKTESESMRKTLRWTEKKLLDLQRLTESYSLPRDLSFDHPRCVALTPLTKPHEATPGPTSERGLRVVRGQVGGQGGTSSAKTDQILQPSCAAISSPPSSRQPPRGLQALGPQGGEEDGGGPASATPGPQVRGSRKGLTRWRR